MTFKLVETERFKKQARKLTTGLREQLKKKLKFLQQNPHHPSLNTHEIRNARGYARDKVFESYVNDKYRMTWEYGSDDKVILRNVDNHDECLRSP